MAESEATLCDLQCRFQRAIADGFEQQAARWRKAKIVVTTERLIVTTIDGDRYEVPYGAVEGFRDRVDVNPSAREEGRYTALCAGDDVVLVTVSGATDHEEFETELFRGALQNAAVRVRHPARSGGVVRSGPWREGRLSVAGSSVTVALGSEHTVEIDRSDVGYVRSGRVAVDGSSRPVVGVEHGRAGRSVETRVALDAEHAVFFEQCMRQDAAANELEPGLEERECGVLIALYSGLEPDQIAARFGVGKTQLRECIGELLDLRLVAGTDRGLIPTARGRRLVYQYDVY